MMCFNIVIKYLKNICIRLSADGVNKVRTKRPHRTPLKYIKKWPPTRDIALFFHSSTGFVGVF